MFETNIVSKHSIVSEAFCMRYHTLIETCKNVGLNVKENFIYVFSRLIEGEKDYEKLLPSAVAR